MLCDRQPFFELCSDPAAVEARSTPNEALPYAVSAAPTLSPVFEVGVTRAFSAPSIVVAPSTIREPATVAVPPDVMLADITVRPTMREPVRAESSCSPAKPYCDGLILSQLSSYR